MAKYVLRRLLLLIPILAAIIIVIFSIMYIAPGDPAQVALGADATDAQLEAKREELGLNRSYFERLGDYFYQLVFKLDFGNSYITGISIADELAERFPYTILLSVLTIVIAVVFGVLLGVYAALHQNRPGDFVSTVIAMVGNSMPNFWVALMLVLIFAYEFKLLPARGSNGWEYWVLPVIANALSGVGTIARQTRSSMLEVINSDYIIMARSKGLSNFEVIFSHALPNALIPVITVAGNSFGRLLGGSLIIESVFNIPGVGNYVVAAVNNRDYIVILGGVIVLGAAFTLIMLFTDLLMAFVDPRIKAQFSGKKKKKTAKAVKAA